MEVAFTNILKGNDVLDEIYKCIVSRPGIFADWTKFMSEDYTTY